MPTVPSYGGPKAQRNAASPPLLDAPNMRLPPANSGWSLPQVRPLPARNLPRLATPQIDAAFQPALSESQATAAGRRLQETGGSIARMGGALGELALHVQNQANQLVVDNAVNRAKEVQMRLAYDKEVGFTSLRGFDALNRPDGKPLAEEYSNKFREALKDISGDLKNEAQRLAFEQEAVRLRQSLENQAIQHETTQYREYNLSTQEGTIATSIQEIGLNYNNPEIVDPARERLKRAVYEQGRLSGKSATWVEARQRDMLSQAHKVATGAALEAGNITYATAYLGKYKEEMNADDVLQVSGVINREVDQRLGYLAAEEALTTMAPAMGPVNDFGRMVRITEQAESGGRERDDQGRLITSPKGAQGKMQVMPGTNRNPGFGVRPAADDSDAERTRVGRDYLAAMVKRYGGDAAKAWAAYNAGPGRLDEALAKAKADGGSWLDHMPAETRGYVTGNLRAMGSGAGAPARPTLSDVLAKVRADPSVNGSPARLRVAEAHATQRFREMEADFKAKGDDLQTRVLTEIVQGKAYEDLPVALRAGFEAYRPEGVDQARSLARRMAEGYNTTNLATYQILSDDKTLASLTDAQMLAAASDLSRQDWQEKVDRRAQLLSPSKGGEQGPGSLNMPAINAVLKDRLASMGLDPTPDPKKNPQDTARVGAITRYIRESVAVAQREAGKKFTDAEVEQFIDGEFMKSHRLMVGGMLGMGRQSQSVRLLGLTLKDVPPDSQKEIRDALRARGVSDPSDADLLAVYFRWKGKP